MTTTRGIAKLWKPVVNVTDLEKGERFWSALTSWIGGTHLDLRVDDVADAVRRTQEIGGVVKKLPELSPSDDEPYLEWAVMADPFGNEFCFVRWPLPPAAVRTNAPLV